MVVIKHETGPLYLSYKSQVLYFCYLWTKVHQTFWQSASVAVEPPCWLMICCRESSFFRDVLRSWRRDVKTQTSRDASPGGRSTDVLTLPDQSTSQTHTRDETQNNNRPSVFTDRTSSIQHPSISVLTSRALTLSLPTFFLIVPKWVCESIRHHTGLTDHS